MKYAILLITTLLLLSACGKSAEERSEEIETFADPQIQAYEKAQQVDDILQEAEKKQRQQIDDAQ